MKKPWWKFWQCRKRDVGPITASKAVELAEKAKRKLHEEDIKKCRAWFDERIDEGISRGWSGIIGPYTLKVSNEAFEIVASEYKERDFFAQLSSKKKGYHISWTRDFDTDHVRARLEEHDSK